MPGDCGPEELQVLVSVCVSVLTRPAAQGSWQLWQQTALLVTAQRFQPPALFSLLPAGALPLASPHNSEPSPTKPSTVPLPFSPLPSFAASNTSRRRWQRRIP